MVYLSTYDYEKYWGMSDDKKINRRDFFKFGLSKSSNAISKRIDRKAPRIGIRPPGAVSEQEFLLLCTRCNDCVDACPHDVIFKPTFSSAKIYGETPFLSLSTKACEFCEDMPCITACKPNALVRGDQPIKIGIAEVFREHCLGAQGQRCDYCERSCPKEFAALTIGEDRVPIIDKDKCVGCGKCEYICPSMTGKALIVNWILDKEI